MRTISTILIASALACSVFLSGCGSSSMTPTSQQEDMTLNALSLSRGVKKQDMYDTVWTMSKTSDDCYKVTVKYKYDEYGNTKEDTFSSYFESETSNKFCPRATQHIYDRL